MLVEIRVRNLVLLEAVDLQLGEGLNVLSGETGEGKSLMMLAVTLLLGGRSRRDLVREGEREAIIEGRFAIAPGKLVHLTDLVAEDATEVCLRRVLTNDGRSRAYLDGSLCPINLLGRIGESLVDVHGQHQSLGSAAAQREVLDRYAGATELAREYREAHGVWSQACEALAEFHETSAERAEQCEFLKFQVQELQRLDPKPDEETALETELKMLASAQEIRNALAHVANSLTDGPHGASPACSAAEKVLGGLQGHDEISRLLERLRSFRIEAEDLAQETESMAGTLESNPKRQELLENRLGELWSASKRHRVAVEELPRRLADLQGELDALQPGEGSLSDLQARIDQARQHLEAVGRKLQGAREKAARSLKRSVMAGLKELRMPNARLDIDLGDQLADEENVSHWKADGPREVGFLVATNPGEKAHPLQKVASGGEMARILLAIKGALAGAHQIPLLIFDEIDAGVGGRVGGPFGKRIAAIAEHHQVLVVTHLAQVAAFAQRHFRVRKQVTKGRTRTLVDDLNEAQREQELAEMLGGDASEAARTQARILMDESTA